MGVQRVGRGRRAVTLVSVVVLVLAQVVPRPALAQAMASVGALAPAGAMVAQRAAAEPAPTAPGVLAPVSDIERQGFGCLAAGGAAAVLSAVGGATETVMVAAGGLLRPSNPVVLWTALAGTVIAAACAAGALATPSVVRMWEYYHDGKRPAPQ